MYLSSLTPTGRVLSPEEILRLFPDDVPWNSVIEYYGYPSPKYKRAVHEAYYFDLAPWERALFQEWQMRLAISAKPEDYISTLPEVQRPRFDSDDLFGRSPHNVNEHGGFFHCPLRRAYMSEFELTSKVHTRWTRTGHNEAHDKGNFRHEIGHGFSWLLNGVSKTPAFIAAHRKDVAILKEKARVWEKPIWRLARYLRFSTTENPAEKWGYLIQDKHPDRGAEEAAGETWAALHGGGCSGTNILGEFRHCTALISGVMKKAEDAYHRGGLKAVDNLAFDLHHPFDARWQRTHLAAEDKMTAARIGLKNADCENFMESFDKILTRTFSLPTEISYLFATAVEEQATQKPQGSAAYLFSYLRQTGEEKNAGLTQEIRHFMTSLETEHKTRKEYHEKKNTADYRMRTALDTCKNYSRILITDGQLGERLAALDKILTTEHSRDYGIGRQTFRIAIANAVEAFLHSECDDASAQRMTNIADHPEWLGIPRQPAIIEKLLALEATCHIENINYRHKAVESERVGKIIAEANRLVWEASDAIRPYEIRNGPPADHRVHNLWGKDYSWTLGRHGETGHLFRKDIAAAALTAISMATKEDQPANTLRDFATRTIQGFSDRYAHIDELPMVAAKFRQFVDAVITDQNQKVQATTRPTVLPVNDRLERTASMA